MVIIFKDTEGNETYLRTAKGHSHANITDLCNEAHRELGNKNDLDTLSLIEMAIRKQLMVLLTEEEVLEVQRNEKNQKSSTSQK